MSENHFAKFDSVANNSAAVFEQLEQHLKDSKNYHALFDAIMMQKKHELGLPLSRPGSIEDVPEEHQPAIEQCYIDSARVVGNLLLEDGKIGEAWVYLRTIREPDSIRKAIEALEVDTENFEEVEQLINVCLYEGAHPVKGLELLLNTHGTCNTVTATDQHLHTMTEAERQQVAAMLVRRLYDDLRSSVLTDVRRKVPTEDDGKTLKELIAGREWLYDDNNYHIDVSHLNAVVRFARALDESCPELPLAVELAMYGRGLADPLQYPAEPPFDEFFEGHLHYFKVLAGQNSDQSLTWFRKRLSTTDDPQDKQMVAYVLVDLLRRVNKLDDAVHFAAEHLRDLNDPQGFSFTVLCHEAGAFDKLKQSSVEKNDVLAYVSAVLTEAKPE